jgi:hypothetical protein
VEIDMRRVVLALTGLALGVVLLFPPWRVSWQDEGRKPAGVSIGHQWVFSAPSATLARNRFFRELNGIPERYSYDISIDIAALLVQSAAVLAIGIGVLAVAPKSWTWVRPSSRQ